MQQGLDGVLKSHSANALHQADQCKKESSPQPPEKKIEDSQETIKCNTASTDTIVPDLTKNLPEFQTYQVVEQPSPVMRQLSDTIVPSISRFMTENPGFFDRTISTVESSVSSEEADAVVARLSDRAVRIRAARERFLSSPVQMRREGTSSTSDLRPGDR